MAKSQFYKTLHFSFPKVLNIHYFSFRTTYLHLWNPFCLHLPITAKPLSALIKIYNLKYVPHIFSLRECSFLLKLMWHLEILFLSRLILGENRWKTTRFTSGTSFLVLFNWLDRVYKFHAIILKQNRCKFSEYSEVFKRNFNIFWLFSSECDVYTWQLKYSVEFYIDKILNKIEDYWIFSTLKAIPMWPKRQMQPAKYFPGKIDAEYFLKKVHETKPK